ncbi:MAG: ABC transporter ATP-binding protein [Actinomycetota bacterium]|nr:ABC transporter ATP-binding protein [Actinomycetota bacterium]
MTGPPGLGVRDLSVAFGQTRAVDQVSLDVAPGEVVSLLGPSGCGKSSLLRAVAGLEPTRTGAVAWDGEDLAAVPVHRRGFGLMFQDGQLFGHRDVAGNVEFGLRMAGMAKPERRRRVSELLDLVGLAGQGRRPVATMSGGEQQRVALARALAPRPRLLLLDEPLSSLDRALRERLTGDLHEILRHTGTTALYVTHDHDEAFTIADRVAVMAAGRLLQVAAPRQIWQRPADQSVARFLGYRWFVGVRTLRAVGVDLDADDEATVALRADSLRLSADGPLRAVVLEASFSRGGTTLRVDVDGLGELEARAFGAADVAPGAVVGLSLEPQVALVTGGQSPPFVHRGQVADWAVIGP